MAINKRYSYVWHTGETATPFTFPMRNSLGGARADIASATLTLVNRDTGVVVIDAGACQSVTGGVLSYLPSSMEMQTPCRFLAEFTATLLLSGLVEPGVFMEGEIVESL